MLAGCSDSDQEWEPVQATTESASQNTTTVTEPITEPITDSTSSSVTEPTAESDSEPTTEPPTQSVVTSDGSKVSLYYNAVVDAAAELRARKNFGESIFYDIDQNGVEEWELEAALSPEDLLEFYNQKLFVDLVKRDHDLEQVSQMQTQWQGYKGIGDSAAFLAREWTEIPQGIRIESAVLHEDPLNRAEGMDTAKTLAEKVAAQYHYWEETGRRDYMHTDKETPPGHRVRYIAINANNTYVKFRLFINGMDYGIHELYQQVFLHEPDTELVIAKEPMVVELQVLEGQLPGEEYIFVYLDSNISGAR